jgi:hypothetical protein
VEKKKREGKVKRKTGKTRDNERKKKEEEKE